MPRLVGRNCDKLSISEAADARLTSLLGAIALSEEFCEEITISEVDGDERTPILDVVTVDATGTVMTEEAILTVETGTTEDTEATEFNGEEIRVDAEGVGVVDAEVMED